MPIDYLIIYKNFKVFFISNNRVGQNRLTKRYTVNGFFVKLNGTVYVFQINGINGIRSS